MQIDCFKRNYGTDTCSRKCKFLIDCHKYAQKLNKIKRKRNKKEDNYDIY